MIVILAMSSEYKRIFSNVGRLIISVWNCLKKDIINTSECLNAWYKRDAKNSL